MPYNAETNFYEREVLDIIKKGQELQRLDLTVSNDMLNNYFLNHAYFIHKKKILVNGAKYIFFIDNYGNIYEFIYNLESDKYWIGYCINQNYKIELQEIVIDIIKLINTTNETHFKNTIQGIVKINEQYKNNDNLIILEENKLREENKQLKEENKQLKKENKQLKENFICPITMAIMKDPVICDDAHTYERSAIEQWLSTNNHSPITRQIINNNNLIPNIVLRNIIQEFEKDHKICF
jgi:cell division protein FtsB